MVLTYFITQNILSKTIPTLCLFWFIFDAVINAWKKANFRKKCLFSFQLKEILDKKLDPKNKINNQKKAVDSATTIAIIIGSLWFLRISYMAFTVSM